MKYKIGDMVVHWTHGVGSVTAIEELHLGGTTKRYYVVEINGLKVWVPVDETILGSIRFPLESTQFKSLFAILQAPGQPLPDRFFERKIALRERMKTRTLEAVCHVIRDLTDRSRQHVLTSDDSSILKTAEEHLLTEWVISMGTTRSEAQREMEVLLQ